MKNSNSNPKMLLLTFIGLVILSSCLKDAQSEGVRLKAGKPLIKIGVIEYANSNQTTAQATGPAVLNCAAKTEQSVSGKKITVIYRILTSESASVLDNIKNLINEGVSAVIINGEAKGLALYDDEICPDQAAGAELHNSVQVPVIITKAQMNPSKACAGLWRITPDSNGIINASVSFLTARMNAMRIVIASDYTDDLTARFITLFSRHYINAGGTIIDILDLNSAEKANTHNFTGWNRLRPTMIYMPTSQSQMIETAKAIRKKGIKTPVFFAQMPSNEKDWESLKEIPDSYVLSTISFQPAKVERSKLFYDACSKKKVMLTPDNMLLADAFFIVADAFNKTGSDMLGSISIMDDDRLLSGRIAFFKDGSVKRPLNVLRFNGSEPEIVWEARIRIPG